MMVRLAEAALYTSLVPPGTKACDAGGRAFRPEWRGGASEDKVSWCDLMRAWRSSTSALTTGNLRGLRRQPALLSAGVRQRLRTGRDNPFRTKLCPHDG